MALDLGHKVGARAITDSGRSGRMGISMVDASRVLGDPDWMPVRLFGNPITPAKGCLGMRLLRTYACPEFRCQNVYPSVAPFRNFASNLHLIIQNRQCASFAPRRSPVGPRRVPCRGGPSNSGANGADGVRFLATPLHVSIAADRFRFRGTALPLPV